MKTRLKQLVWSIVLLSMSLSCLAAEPDAAEFLTRYKYYVANYDLNADGSHTERHEWSLSVLHESALENVKHASISFSTSIQAAEILHAYTLKADGRRIEVPKSNYQSVVNSGKEKNAPIFSDYTTLSVVFPELAVGDSVAFAYKLTQIEPIFPGHFSTAGTFSRIYAYDDVLISISAPSTLWVQYAAREMQEKRTEKDGRVHLQWTYQNPQPIKSKRRDWTVYDTEQEPGYAFSTFKTYADIAAAYAVRARPKAAVTPEIQALANQISQDLKTRHAQARALYDWVATNITYAGNCIGVGAVVPHDISFILENRMGDCKDHATLLQALLAAKNIESTQALVNAGSAYKLPKIPVVSTVNHVITYIPSLNLFADSTSQTTPFGMLPFSDAGKPVLLLDGFNEGMKTPAPSVGTNQQQLKSVLQINADGSASGEISITLKGVFAVNARSQLRRLRKSQEAEMVKNVLSSMGFIGSGELEKEDPKALLADYQYKVKLKMKELILLPGPAAFTIYPLFTSEAPIHSFLGATTDTIDTHDTTCTNGTSEEQYVYRFPKNMKVLAIPRNMAVHNETLSYRANYRLKGNTLSVKRVLDDKTPGPICTPSAAADFQALAAKISKNTRAQVVYQ